VTVVVKGSDQSREQFVLLTISCLSVSIVVVCCDATWSEPSGHFPTQTHIALREERTARQAQPILRSEAVGNGISQRISPPITAFDF
jgi:hypothetical protein